MNDFQFDDQSSRPATPRITEQRVVYSQRRTFLSSFGTAFGQLLGIFFGIVVCAALVLGGIMLYLKFSLPS